MSSYYLAVAIVVGAPIAAVLAATGVTVLARDAISRSPVIAAIGMFATLAAVGNLLLERRCEKTVNRPIITAFVGPDGCRPGAVAAIELVVLLLLATALAVRAADVRR